jgi:putative acetyltransferase
MMLIESATAKHDDAIRVLTIAAFESSEFGHNGEADLIEAIQEDSKDSEQVLSLVAIQESSVVGHILLSPASIVCRGEKLDGMGLAPMSVLPKYQRQGIGSLLVKAALQNLSDQGNAFTIVAGHPSFYSRFGFEPAIEFGIRHGFAGMPQDVFFLHCEDKTRVEDFRDGMAYYHAAFGSQHDEG